ncbi:MAG: (2Fe-2S)-binding protein [Candidatus Krumholzibacteria bacterium]|nr:(2Fe-2S)-binding protein [Candidatus Krumholzibacteria bacterium]
MAKKILCHCEDVETEELYSALRQGYGDLETLKRYTGIGTGKCQGKCCFIQTLRLLHDMVTRTGGMEREATGPKDLMIDPDDIRVPTLRPPVLPLRIKDIVEGERGEP